MAIGCDKLFREINLPFYCLRGPLSTMRSLYAPDLLPHAYLACDPVRSRNLHLLRTQPRGPLRKPTKISSWKGVKNGVFPRENMGENVRHMGKHVLSKKQEYRKNLVTCGYPIFKCMGKTG
jgi:hypothetical protein